MFRTCYLRLRHLVGTGLFYIKSLKNEHIFFCLRAYFFRRGNVIQASRFYHAWLAHRLQKQKLGAKLQITSTPTLLHETSPGRDAHFSLMMGSRMNSNNNFQLTSFLETVEHTTTDSTTLEILIGIDHDDNIAAYKAILAAHPNLSIKLISSERGRGYYDLHMKYHLMLDFMAPSSKAVLITSDDCYFNRKGWDSEVLQAVHQHRDGVFFLNLFLDRDLGSTNPLLADWWTFQRGPSSIYPAVGRQVLETTRRVAYDLPDYSAFGASLMVDSFFEMLHIHLYQHSMENRMIRLPGIIRRRVENAKESSKISKKLRHRVVDGLMLYDEKLKPEHQEFLTIVAKKLALSLDTTATAISKTAKY